METSTMALQQAKELLEGLQDQELTPAEAALAVVTFFNTLVKNHIDESWARKLSEIYLSGL